MQWCCRSSDRAAGKRCSYTAMAFARNPTSSGTVNSGNSLRNDLSLRYKRKQDSREGNVATVHVCRTTPPTTLHNYKTNFSTHIQQLIREDLTNTSKKYLESSSYPVHENHKPRSQVCSSYPASPPETITVTPDAMVPERTKEYINDEPEKYLKEIKLKIIQHEKEYG